MRNPPGGGWYGATTPMRQAGPAPAPCTAFRPAARQSRLRIPGRTGHVFFRYVPCARSGVRPWRSRPCGRRTVRGGPSVPQYLGSCRCLHDPLWRLPTGAMVAGGGFAPRWSDAAFHGAFRSPRGLATSAGEMSVGHPGRQAPAERTGRSRRIDSVRLPEQGIGRSCTSHPRQPNGLSVTVPVTPGVPAPGRDIPRPAAGKRPPRATGHRGRHRAGRSPAALHSPGRAVPDADPGHWPGCCR